jgi:hypothetical protein
MTLAATVLSKPPEISPTALTFFCLLVSIMNFPLNFV